MTPSLVVLGLGNLVHGDDGIGVHALRELEHDPRLPPGVVLLDGGTHGLGLLPHIAGFSHLLVVDAVDAGEPPGTVVRFEGSALNGLPGKASVHQLGFADMMVALKLLGESPPELVVLGVQPLSTEWSIELTPPVRESLPALLDSIVRQLEIWIASLGSAAHELYSPGQDSPGIHGAQSSARHGGVSPA
jgi:hydrogenase maturation protease